MNEYGVWFSLYVSMIMTIAFAVMLWMAFFFQKRSTWQQKCQSDQSLMRIYLLSIPFALAAFFFTVYYMFIW